MRPPKGGPAERWDAVEANEGTPEEELWFLPGPDLEEDDIPPGAPPLPRADRRPLVDLRAWRRAEAELAGALAHVALLFGELDARLRDAPAGLGQRLALREAADLSWWSGDGVPLDRLALWTSLRIGSTGDRAPSLARTGWAVRRLSAGAAPSAGLAAFLERPEAIEAAGAEGAEPGAVLSLAELLGEAADLHPVTQAALLFQAWRRLGAMRSRDIEAGVLAARHAARMSRRPGQGALFLPLALTGSGALRAQGPPASRLCTWLAGAEQATLAALMQIDRISAWRRRADAAVADLSGRTPARLLDVLEAWPLVSAPLAEQEAGASRAAVQRNLDRLSDRGLIRELTRQGRYRLWTAAV